jgi:hypothetical protein
MLIRIVKTWTLNDWRWGAKQTLFQTWVDMDWTWPCKLELSSSFFIKGKEIRELAQNLRHVKHQAWKVRNQAVQKD